jgi:hypothetical protein
MPISSPKLTSFFCDPVCGHAKFNCRQQSSTATTVSRKGRLRVELAAGRQVVEARCNALAGLHDISVPQR